MTQAKLNKKQLASHAGSITVYNIDATSREYLSSSVEYLALGVGLPANAFTDAPGEARPGFAICRTVNLTGWEYVTDRRGETVYDINRGQPVQVTLLGDYPANVTQLPPATPYDKWTGSGWLTDETAHNNAATEQAELKKSALLTQAQSTISLWQTELQLGIISPQDQARLVSWLGYIHALQAIDTAYGPDIHWPATPGLNP